MTDRRRLVVLFGGQSAEHDVSCVTARHVLAAASPDRYVIDAIGITRDGSWVRTDTAALLDSKTASALPEALSAVGDAIQPAAAIGGGATVVLPLLHGPMGEDGTVQGLLDLANVPYVGAGVLGSAICMDKTVAKQLADSHGIAQARWRGLHVDDIDDRTAATIIDELGTTVFVKPANMGSSVGVSRAKGLGELRSAIDLAAAYDDLAVAVGAGTDDIMSVTTEITELSLGRDDVAVRLDLDTCVRSGS